MGMKAAHLGMTRSGMGAAPVRVQHLEITQTVQDVAHTVPLISGKPTVVRAAIESNAGSSIGLRGSLVLRTPTSENTVSSINETTLIPGPIDLGAVRGDINQTLNFIVPDALTRERTLDASLAGLVDTSSGAPVTVLGAAANRSVIFQDSAPLRLVIVGIRYHAGNPASTVAPRTVDVDLLVSWLRRAYPLTDLQFEYRVVDSNFTWPFQSTSINAQLAAIRNQDISNGTDYRTHYYGLVHDKDGTQFMRGRASGIPTTPDPSTVASGPTGGGDFGWDHDGSYGDWYGAHELAHTFGRFHPGYCAGNSRDDLSYPYDNGQLASTANTTIGFDFGDNGNGIAMRALPGETWHDVMTYCSNQWMSDYTYRGILNRLIAEGCDPGTWRRST